MTPIVALAGLGGLSSEDELWLTALALVWMVVHALFLPIFTFDHPPQWMVLLQPVIVICGLLVVHGRLRASKPRLSKRFALYVGTYGSLLFATNMAGEARGVFTLAGDMISQACVISGGQGVPRDTRP